ncbi:hypothetical protein AA0120_g10146 [Alternaria tenuissima]|nr:hypothetical protein AA0120_g10146 [Alternaria tenuissima]
MISSDNRATALHGQDRLEDVENYLDERPGFTIVVFIDYDCEMYHENIKDAFTRLQMPSMPYDVRNESRPYFEVLQHDGPIADPTSEHLQLSESLEEALRALYSQSTDVLSEWDFDKDLMYPYPKLYHNKHLCIGSSAQVLEPRQRVDLEVLFWYVIERLASDYEELEELTSDGTTNLRYMVDMEAYRLMHGRDDDPPRQSELTDVVLGNDEIPEGSFALILPATINGYGFHNKKWNVLIVEHIRDINWNSGVFEHRLVLEEDKKELVKALVTVHIEKSRDVKMDFMDGKGEGLIMLLHGGPGTGKTLTAESIAEFVQRPLYRVTCGDIGTDAESVEKYLQSALYIGSTWNCVVLLDEADVFLEERTKMDLQRNALVSVFLRVLEYYDGILILTTNRIGTFDEAFKSRVQLALHYPPLDREGRWEVWRNFVQALSEAGENINDDEINRKLDVLARHKLNGRQIRNTVSTARQLARYKKETLRYAHVNQAVKVVNDFEKYVTDVHGHDDEEYARDQGLRNDDNVREAD